MSDQKPQKGQPFNNILPHSSTAITSVHTGNFWGDRGQILPFVSAFSVSVLTLREVPVNPYLGIK